MDKNVQLNNGTYIPRVGLGVYLSPKGEDTKNSVKWALEAGYRHIDTAMIYNNEESVAEGIKESGIPRKDIFLTTKLWNEDIRQDKVFEAFEKSLKRLGTDYIDLYLIHWPAVGYEKAWIGMEKIYQSGKAKAIGVSNFNKHHLEKIAKVGSIVPAMNQIEAHPYFNNQKLIDYCVSKNIMVTGWSPLGGTGGNILGDNLLQSLAVKYDKTVAQVVLRWHIQRGTIIIPKSLHKERIIQNRDIFDFEINNEDMLKINQLERGIRVGADPDNFNF